MIIPSRKVPGVLLLPISRGRMKQGVPRQKEKMLRDKEKRKKEFEPRKEHD